LPITNAYKIVLGETTMQARDVTSRCSLLIWHYFNTLILIVSHLHALLEGISCSVLHYVHLSNYISFLSESVFFFFWGEGGAYKTIKTEERAMEKDSARPISLERMCFLSTPAYLGPWWIQAQDRYGFQSLLGPERPRENCAVVGLISGLVLEAQNIPQNRPHYPWSYILSFHI